jgi:methionyl-tRNA formyltransferase
MALRVVFMGTPDFSVPTLSEIVSAGHDVAGVYTQPPRPAGRGMEARKSPVHVFAEEAAIPVFTPKTLRRREIQEGFASLSPDVAVVAAYGLLLPPPVLRTPPLGCLNLHASLLPRWRGAAPIQRAIMAGDKETGVMIMKMDQGLDTGPVALADDLLIGPDVTAGEIHDQLSLMGASLMLSALSLLERGELIFSRQPSEGATYAPKITKEETRIDWTKTSAEVHNQIRGLSPYPGAWFEALLGGKAERVKVLRSVLVPGKGDPGQLLDANLTVACGSLAVRLTQVQRSGKRPMGGADFLRGFPLGRGTQFE